MATISTHVLDTARGLPAEGVPIMLEALGDDDWLRVGGGITNADGRVTALLTEVENLDPGVYRVTFDTFAYYQRFKTRTFYPMVRIIFEVFESETHYHVPLLLSPWGYSTYRGS